MTITVPEITFKLTSQENPGGIEGEITGTLWTGEFRVKTYLNYADQLRRDQVRRELLGREDGNSASPRASSAALVFSELFVRIVNAPSWWNEHENGTLLADDSVVRFIYNKALKAETLWTDARKAKVKDAIEYIKQHIDKLEEGQ